MASPFIQLSTNRTIQSSGYGRQCRVAHVGSNKIVAVYANVNTVYARCGTKNGTEISWGTQQTVSTGGLNASIVALTDSLVVITYRDSGSPYTQRVVAASVSGTTLTLGSAVATGATSGDEIGICRIDNTRFGLTYHISPTNYVRAGSVSGTTISLGTQQSLGNHSSLAVDITCLDDEETLLPIYRNASSDIEIKKCSVSGTTVTVSGTTTTPSTEYQFCKIEALSETEFVCFHPYTTGYIRGRVQHGEWTGSAFSMSTAVEVTTTDDDVDQQERVGLTVDKSQRILIAAWTSDTGVTHGNEGWMRAGSIALNGTITLGSSVQFASGAPLWVDPTTMESRDGFLITARLNDGLYYRYFNYNRVESTFTGDSQIKSYNTSSLDLERDSIQYADKQNPTGLGGYSTASIEMWVKFESLPANNTSNTLLSRIDRSSADNNYAIILNNNAGSRTIIWRVGNNAGSSVDYTTSWTPSTGSWIHLACTYSSATNQYLRIYVNGSQLGSGQQNTGGISMGNDGEYFSVGAFYDVTGSGSALTADAKIDEVRFWNTQISTTQINNNMHTQIAPTTSGLVGYWRFNGDANDLTGNGNNLTLRNGASYDGDVPFSTTIPGVLTGNANLKPQPKTPQVIIIT